MGFRLTVIAGPEQGRTQVFDRLEITLGRTVENDMVLTHPSISRQHVRIREKGGAYTLKDLGSSNGSWLNGTRVQGELVLRSGDQLRTGEVQLRFDTLAEGPQPKPEQSETRSNGRPPVASSDRRSVIRSKGLRRSESPQGIKEAKPATPARTVPVRNVAPVGSPLAAARPPMGNVLLGRWRNLPRVWQVASIVSLGLLVLGVATFLVRGGTRIIEIALDHSDNELVVGEVNASGEPVSYGQGPLPMMCSESNLGLCAQSVDVTCRSVAAFPFHSAGGRLVVTYQTAAIERRQEVEIQLNQVRISLAALALNEWSAPQRLALPHKYLRDNGVNLLRFVHTANSEKGLSEPWAVRVLSISEQPLPEVDRAKAYEEFTRAQNLYRIQNINPGNLYKAYEKFALTRDYLEKLPVGARPEIYLESVEMIERVETELEARARSLLFTYQQQLELNRPAKAKAALVEILQTIPNPDDPRYALAKARLAEME